MVTNLALNTIVVMPGLVELTVRYEKITERIQDRKYMMKDYLGNETKMTYDFKEILDIGVT